MQRGMFSLECFLLRLNEQKKEIFLLQQLHNPLSLNKSETMTNRSGRKV